MKPEQAKFILIIGFVQRKIYLHKAQRQDGKGDRCIVRALPQSPLLNYYRRSMVDRTRESNKAPKKEKQVVNARKELCNE